MFMKERSEIILKIIQRITKSMKKRLCLAEYDIDFALRYKDEYPEIAKNHYNLSIEEMNRFKIQHDNVVQIINNFKKEGHEVPEGMQYLYDYLHNEYMEWASKIKAKQDMFK